MEHSPEPTEKVKVHFIEYERFVQQYGKEWAKKHLESCTGHSTPAREVHRHTGLSEHLVSEAMKKPPVLETVKSDE